MQGSLCFLGTGSSLGVPVIGCKCLVCTSADKKNIRMRASALLQISGKTFLIDAGPDHRQQALSYGIDHLDGVILTHEHYDHIGGLDDLKVYSYNKDKLPCLLSLPTYEGVKGKFPYLFSSSDGEDSFFFSCQILKDLFEKVEFEGVPMECVSFLQAKMQVTGIKIGDLAYISDIKTYSEELIARLKGIKTLIISAAKGRPTNMHFSFEEAFAFAALVGAKTTYITHIGHEIGQEDLQKILPQSVFLAYDGLTISFQTT
ncbi:MAG: MBL fold metallo-hydrolase [Chlamydiota bacterium]